MWEISLGDAEFFAPLFSVPGGDFAQLGGLEEKDFFSPVRKGGKREGRETDRKGP